MFVQNQIGSFDDHRKVITTEIENAAKVLLMVAYVRENGVDLIVDKINGKPTKLLCSLDMGITQLSGIKKLLENNVEVKVYKSNAGTFHSKIWLFGDNNNQWRMLIGSANLTRSAFIDNVEASVLVDEQSIILDALKFFNSLWNRENSSPVSLEEIESLQDKIAERKSFNTKNPQSIARSGEDDAKKIAILFEYTQNWIDIPKYDSEGISSVWRGWYLIPDHGHIDDAKIQHMESYLPFIKQGIEIGKNSRNTNYSDLLSQFVTNSYFQREILRLSPHDLFVRQAKII